MGRAGRASRMLLFMVHVGWARIESPLECSTSFEPTWWAQMVRPAALSTSQLRIRARNQQIAFFRPQTPAKREKVRALQWTWTVQGVLG